MTEPRRFDLVGLGEAMLRLSTPLGERLAAAHSLALEIAGAESNVCVALCRLGRKCGWVSRLPDHALADRVLRELSADGVDLSAVVRAPGERLGLYYLEFAAPPRTSQVIYDRAQSAMSALSVEDVDWDYLLAARCIHLTGITAALSDSCYRLVDTAMQRARAAGVIVSFDVNYRARLWDAARAGERLRPLLAQADIVFCSSADAQRLFACGGELEAQMRALQRLAPQSVALYCTRSAQGAGLLTTAGYRFCPATPVTLVDRIGAGDAFAAGALDGWLSGDAAEGLARGVALAAIALSQHGDRVLTSRAELEAVMAHSGAQDVAR